MRLLKYTAPLLCVLALCVTLLATPAHAQAPALKLSDYYDTSFVEGNIRTARYIFDIEPFTRLEPSPWTSSADVRTYTGDFTYTFNAANVGYSGNFASRTYLLGVQSFENIGMPANGTIDISDVMPGATISVELHYNIVLTKHAGSESINLTTRSGYMQYNRSGTYIGTIWGSTQNQSLVSTTDSLKFHKVDLLEVSDSAAYILPFINVNGSTPDDGYALLGFDFQAFYIEVPINMIYENTLSMNKVNSTLDNIYDAIQNTDYPVGGTMDKVDSAVGSVTDSLNSVAGKEDDLLNDALHNLDGLPDELNEFPFISLWAGEHYLVNIIMRNPFVEPFLIIGAIFIIIRAIFSGKWWKGD